MAQMVENPSAMQETRIQALDQKGPRRREWQPTSAFLPGESPRQRIYTESDTTKRLTVTYLLELLMAKHGNKTQGPW